jgi:hypothetical protein
VHLDDGMYGTGPPRRWRADSRGALERAPLVDSAVPESRERERLGARGVSCASAASCFAVGYYEVHAGRSLPLVERWNGRRWSVQHVPMHHRAKHGDLMGISCASPVACVAVGSSSVHPGGASKLLLERWNGRRWSKQNAPLPSDATDGFLDGVSCVSAHACIAVGASYVGYQISPLAERWNGHHWSRQKIPGRGMGGLSGVSCFSAVACTAVGSTPPSTKTLAERWNGHHWSIQRTPNPGGTKTTAQNTLSAIWCPSARACTAVGSYHPPHVSNALVEQWNGSKWAVQSLSRVGIASWLYGISCTSAHSCTAVGFYDSHIGSIHWPSTPKRNRP